MAGDYAIRIKTAINNNEAKSKLQQLKAEAQSTAKQLSSLDKQISNIKGNTKLADSLKAAKDEAAATVQQLDAVNAQLEQMKTAEVALLSSTPGFTNMSAGTLGQVAQGNVERANPELVSQSDTLAASLSKADAAVEQLNAKYTEQQSTLSALETQHAGLSSQFEKETAALKEETAAQDQSAASAERMADTKERVEGAFSKFSSTLKKGSGTAGGSISGMLGKTFSAFGLGFKKTEKLATYMGSRLKRIIFGALIFNAVSYAFRQLSEYMKNALSQSTAFSAAMANLKGAALTAVAPLMQALTPALTAIANAAAIAFSYITKLVSLLTGKSVGAMKAFAASTNKAAAAAKGATLSIDELNVIDQGRNGASAPNFEFDAQNDTLDSMMAMIKDGDWGAIGTMLADKINSAVDSFDPKAFGTKLGTVIQSGISFAFNLVFGIDWNNIGKQLAILFNNTLDQIDAGQVGALFAAKFAIVIRAVGTFLENLEWSTLGSQLSSFVIGFLDALTDALNSVDWEKVGNGILTMLESIDWPTLLTSLGDFISASMPILLAALVGFAGEYLGKQLTETLLPKLLELALKGIASLFTKLIPTVFSWLASLLSSIVAAIGLWPVVLAALVIAFIAVIAIWGDGIQQKLSEVDAWLQGIFTKDWSKSFGILGNLLNGFMANVKNIWDAVKQIFNGVIDFIRGVFTGDWERAWKGVQEIFAGIFKGFKTIALAPLNIVIGLLNGLIDGINWVINKANTLSFKNPFTGKIEGINFPTIGKIPYLATGAVIPANSEFLAVLGDQTNGTNIEAPLDTIKQAFLEVMGQGVGNQDINLTIETTLDGELVYRNQRKVSARKGYQMGANPSFA